MKDFKKLLQLLKPYKLQAFFSIITNALSVIFALFSYTMIIPFLRILFNPEKLINHAVPFKLTPSALQHNLFYFLSNVITDNGIIAALVLVSSVIVVASLFKNGFLFWSKYLMAPMMNGVARDYQRKIFNKLVSLPLSFFSDERKGNILSRMTSDVNEVRLSIQYIIKLLFTGPISILVFLVFLFFASFKLTLFVIVFLPIMGFIIFKVSSTLKGSAYMGQKIQGDILNNTEEVISGLRIIKAFNAQKKVNTNFAGITHDFFTTMNRVERRIWLASPMSEFLATIIVMVIMYFGGVLVLGETSSLSSEAFIAYLVVFSQLIPPAKETINAYYISQKGLASIKRIEEIIITDEKINEIEKPIEITDFNKNLLYKNVDFNYDDDDRKILNDINININKGEIIAVVGESGAGKSTLADLLPRFYDVSKGDIFVDDINLKDLKIKDLRELFGVVSQSSILFNDTIEKNIAFGVEKYSQEQLIEAAKIANAYDFIMDKPNGFKTNIGESGTKLSGGQQQRISIARAVLKNPPILILDEATSALDTESEKLVQDALTKIMKNRTAIVIAHRLSTVKNADKIYVMQEGKIVEQGKHSELIEKGGIYKRLVDLQMV